MVLQPLTLDNPEIHYTIEYCESVIELWHHDIMDLVQSLDLVIHCIIYIVGSKSFQPDIQKPRQMENARGIYSAINELLIHRCEKCVEIKGDYVEK